MNDRRAVLEVGAGDATDGAIDTQFIAEMFPDRYALEDSDGIPDPDAIADTCWQLHCQHRSAWTFEMDLRPWIERW